MRRRLAVGLVLAAFAPTAGSGAPPDAPEAVVKAIYKIAAGPKGDYLSCAGDDTACSIDGPRIRALFTSSLNKEMDAMNERSRKDQDAVLDFDPITDSQDPSIGKLLFKPEAAALGAVTVDVTFWPRPQKGERLSEHDLRYDLKREGGAWRVDNIRAVTPGAEWDLRKIIEPEATP